MRLEQGHPQDDRAAMMPSITNPSLSATYSRLALTIFQFEMANLTNHGEIEVQNRDVYYCDDLDQGVFVEERILTWPCPVKMKLDIRDIERN